MGFVAGTLVHTDKGLVPIEQLKVGDLVLSRPDNDPQAPNQYKRVTKTFKSPQKLPIVRVHFKRGTGHTYMNLFCTANHPFWCVVRQQWLPAIKFNGHYHQLLDIKGNAFSVTDDVGYVMATGKAKVGICPATYSDYRRNSGYSMMIDFAGNKIRYVGGDAPIWNGISEYYNIHPEEDIILLPHYDKKEDFPPYSLSRFYMQAFNERLPIDFIHPDNPNPNPDLEPAFKAYVYNIEVEDYHTYYVGQAGIWIKTEKQTT